MMKNGYRVNMKKNKGFFVLGENCINGNFQVSFNKVLSPVQNGNFQVFMLSLQKRSWK